jgi:hypothetical protein
MNLAALPRDASTHLRLALLGAGAELSAKLGTDAPEWLGDYAAEIGGLAGRAVSTKEWAELVRVWAHGSPELPLSRLAATLHEPLALDLLLGIALAGEDARIGALLGENGHMTAAALTALWRSHDGRDDPGAVRRSLNWLTRIGLVRVANPDAQRSDWNLSVSAMAWDALAGDPTPPAGCRLLATNELLPFDRIVGEAGVIERARLIAQAMAEDPTLVALLRGPARNGRATLAGAAARSLGRPLIVADAALLEDAEAWRQLGLFAFFHDGVIVIALAAGVGEVREVPGFALEPVRLILLMGQSGGVRLPDRPQAALCVPAPHRAARLAHWRNAVPELDTAGAAALADAFRLTGGTIHRAAVGARLTARQAGRQAITRADVRAALRDLQDSRLETVAARVDTGSEPEFLALDEVAEGEIEALAARCRNREALAPHAGPGPGAAGVRALFAGPSGAGKTLAARRLAHDLARDLWRVDLAATVSKYIGETEKALDRAFAAAEELDTILLLDEGDALMARRTDVGNANDRYANLETNFLLQRIESFSGILIVTTNAADRIDKAFQRRMDVVVPFRAPDEFRRYQILDHQLGAHAADDGLVQEIAVRCALSGGQLRNVALHARLLALDAGMPIDDEMLRRAVFREYRKIDGHCPLKPLLSEVG